MQHFNMAPQDFKKTKNGLKARKGRQAEQLKLFIWKYWAHKIKIKIKLPAVG